MHPYLGNLNKYPRAISLPDDGDEAAAATFNTPHEALADRTEWMRQRLVSSAVLNWPYKSTLPHIAYTPAVYDAVGARWLVAGRGASWSQDGLSWTLFPALPVPEADILVIGAHPVTGRVVALTNKNTSYYIDPGSTAWSQGSSHMGAPSDSSSSNETKRIDWIAASQTFIVVGGVQSAFEVGTAHIATSPDGITWTLRDAQIPASLQNTVRWHTALTPSRVLAISRANGRSIGLISSNGAAWDTVHLPVSGGQAPLSVGYNEYDDEFLLAVGTAANAPTSITWFASRDALTWSQRSTVTTWSPAHIRCTLGAWIALTDIINFGHYIMVSLDGAVTWRKVPLRIEDPGATVAVRLATSPIGQCLAHDSTEVFSSFQL